MRHLMIVTRNTISGEIRRGEGVFSRIRRLHEEVCTELASNSDVGPRGIQAALRPDSRLLTLKL